MCRVLPIYSLLIHESPFRNMPFAQRQAKITGNTTTLHRKHGTPAHRPLAGDSSAEEFAFFLNIVVTTAFRPGAESGKSGKGKRMRIELHLVTVHRLDDRSKR